MSLAQLQDRLQAESREYQKIQEELQGAVDARQKLDAQQTENEEVKKVPRSL
jgi:prefoldin beta subunit